MAALRHSFISILFLATCAIAGESSDIYVENNLEKCVAINSKSLIYFGDMPILKMNIRHISNIGHCGCKSAISSYTVFQTIEGHESFIISGEFTFLERKELTLPIAVHKQFIVKFTDVRIVISCANPQ